MLLPVRCSNRQGGGERSIQLGACACVGEAVPQTITDGVSLIYSWPPWACLYYMHD